MDAPKSTKQRKAKQQLISNHRLRLANQNSGPFDLFLARDEIFAQRNIITVSVIVCSVVLVCALVICCIQRRTYKKRMTTVRSFIPGKKCFNRRVLQSTCQGI